MSAATAHPEAGFSLLELLVVLALMALAVGIAVPMLRASTGPQNVRLLTARLASDLQVSRANAILLRRVVTFVIDPDRHTYALDGISAPVNLPPQVRVTLVAARQSRHQKSPFRIEFYPDGSSTGGQLTVADSQQSRTLAVAWLTGAVTLQGRRP